MGCFETTRKSSTEGTYFICCSRVKLDATHAQQAMNANGSRSPNRLQFCGPTLRRRTHAEPCTGPLKLRKQR
eukprot:8032356-Alexandrium_andersonii.AAC.1